MNEPKIEYIKGTMGCHIELAPDEQQAIGQSLMLEKQGDDIVVISDIGQYTEGRVSIALLRELLDSTIDRGSIKPVSCEWCEKEFPGKSLNNCPVCSDSLCGSCIIPHRRREGHE